ncbi:hypothetical protein CPB84DRAFT_1852217 [Gymnopilus junonius]|uniref:Uncharacterized protein n=1 Tax=Gymnopilus junonius TaxID=109634 RepID=A0A9P5TI41_GYMJU|nr:hypothetical protein CPB84DRAFT_1852217 [Gymnopilus junonius]
MDIASTIYKFTMGIVNFISEHEDKDALHDQISNIVVQIQSIVAPLMLRDITDEPLKQVLQSLQHVLSTVDGHLQSWKENRTRRVFAVVNPWAVTSEIREDRVQLMHQYIMLMGAMQVIDHVKGYNLLLPDGADPRPMTNASKEVETQARPALKEVSGEDDGVSQFWHSCVGSNLEVAEAQLFCNALSHWLGRKLSHIFWKHLLLRLDENDTDPIFPLLVWISDDLCINKPKVAIAQKKGVCMVQVSSTKTAKVWLKVNKSILKKHDTPGDLCLISNQG